MADLTGKVAVITGGTRGLGLAIAQTYAEAGAAVVVASRSEGSVRAAVEQLGADGAKASGIPVDVSNREDVEALAQHAIDQWGGFDIWVNNAGISPTYGPTFDVAPEEIEATFQTNIFGTYYGSLAAMRYFLPRGEGKLINVAGRGSRKPTPFQNAYASSKAWMTSFTMGLAEEYKESGVGIYLFNPGMVLTDMLTEIKVVEGSEERLDAYPTVLRLFANRADIPARKALWIAAEAENGVADPSVRVLTPERMVRGVLATGLRKLAGRPKPLPEIDIKSVAPASQEAHSAEG